MATDLGHDQFIEDWIQGWEDTPWKLAREREESRKRRAGERARERARMMARFDALNAERARMERRMLVHRRKAERRLAARTKWVSELGVVRRVSR